MRCATEGAHVTSDDFLKSMEIPVVERKIKEMENDKKMCLAMQKNEEDSHAILNQQKQIDNLTALELEKLFSWDLVPKKKMGSKHQKITKWKEIVNNSIVPPMFDPWVGDDDANLAKMKEKEIDLTDTAFVRQVAVEKQKAKASSH